MSISENGIIGATPEKKKKKSKEMVALGGAPEHLEEIKVTAGRQPISSSIYTRHESAFCICGELYLSTGFCLMDR